MLAVQHSHDAYGEVKGKNQKLISNPETDAQVMVTKLKNHRYDAVVAFRGTSSKTDARFDLDVRKSVPWFLNSLNPPTYVHSGFARQYNSLRKPLFELLDKNTKNILVTGHSLGSISCLFALDLAIHKPNVNVDCVTFGSPRIGGSNFAKAFDLHVDNNTRCVHNWDIVTGLPMPFRFTHVSGLFKLKTKRRSRGPIDDHNLEHYIEAIKNLK